MCFGPQSHFFVRCYTPWCAPSPFFRVGSVFFEEGSDNMCVDACVEQAPSSPVLLPSSRTTQALFGGKLNFGVVSETQAAAKATAPRATVRVLVCTLPRCHAIAQLYPHSPIQIKRGALLYSKQIA